jgi:hypothetical protein
MGLQCPRCMRPLFHQLFGLSGRLGKICVMRLNASTTVVMNCCMALSYVLAYTHFSVPSWTAYLPAAAWYQRSPVALTRSSLAQREEGDNTHCSSIGFTMMTMPFAFTSHSIPLGHPLRGLHIFSNFTQSTGMKCHLAEAQLHSSTVRTAKKPWSQRALPGDCTLGECSLLCLNCHWDNATTKRRTCRLASSLPDAISETYNQRSSGFDYGTTST